MWRAEDLATALYRSSSRDAGSLMQELKRMAVNYQRISDACKKKILEAPLKLFTYQTMPELKEYLSFLKTSGLESDATFAGENERFGFLGIEGAEHLYMFNVLTYEDHKEGGYLFDLMSSTWGEPCMEFSYASSRKEVRLDGLFYGEAIEPSSCAIFNKVTLKRDCGERGKSSSGGWARVLLNLLDCVAIHMGATRISLADSSDVRSLRGKCNFQTVSMASLHLLRHGFTLYNSYGYIPTHNCPHMDELLIHGNSVLYEFQRAKEALRFENFDCDTFLAHEKQLYETLLERFPGAIRGKPRILHAQAKPIHGTQISVLRRGADDKPPQFAMEEYSAIF